MKNEEFLLYSRLVRQSNEDLTLKIAALNGVVSAQEYERLKEAGFRDLGPIKAIRTMFSAPAAAAKTEQATTKAVTEAAKTTTPAAESMADLVRRKIKENPLATIGGIGAAGVGTGMLAFGGSKQSSYIPQYGNYYYDPYHRAWMHKEAGVKDVLMAPVKYVGRMFSSSGAAVPAATTKAAPAVAKLPPGVRAPSIADIEAAQGQLNSLVQRGPGKQLFAESAHQKEIAKQTEAINKMKQLRTNVSPDIDARATVIGENSRAIARDKVKSFPQQWNPNPAMRARSAIVTDAPIQSGGVSAPGFATTPRKSMNVSRNPEIERGWFAEEPARSVSSSPRAVGASTGDVAAAGPTEFLDESAGVRFDNSPEQVAARKAKFEARRAEVAEQEAAKAKARANATKTEELRRRGEREIPTSKGNLENLLAGPTAGAPAPSAVAAEAAPRSLRANQAQNRQAQAAMAQSPETRALKERVTRERRGIPEAAGRVQADVRSNLRDPDAFYQALENARQKQQQNRSGLVEVLRGRESQLKAPAATGGAAPAAAGGVSPAGPTGAAATTGTSASRAPNAEQIAADLNAADEALAKAQLENQRQSDLLERLGGGGPRPEASVPAGGVSPAGPTGSAATTGAAASTPPPPEVIAIMERQRGRKLTEQEIKDLSRPVNTSAAATTGAGGAAPAAEGAAAATGAAASTPPTAEQIAALEKAMGRKPTEQEIKDLGKSVNTRAATRSGRSLGNSQGTGYLSPTVDAQGNIIPSRATGSLPKGNVSPEFAGPEAVYDKARAAEMAKNGPKSYSSPEDIPFADRLRYQIKENPLLAAGLVGGGGLAAGALMSGGDDRRVVVKAASAPTVSGAARDFGKVLYQEYPGIEKGHAYLQNILRNKKISSEDAFGLGVNALKTVGFTAGVGAGVRKLVKKEERPATLRIDPRDLAALRVQEAKTAGVFMAPSQLNNSSPQALIDDLEARMTHSGGNYRKTAQAKKAGHTKVAFTLDPNQRNALIGALGSAATLQATLRLKEPSRAPLPYDPSENNSAMHDFRRMVAEQTYDFERFSRAHPGASTLLAALAGAGVGYTAGSKMFQKYKDTKGP